MVNWKLTAIAGGGAFLLSLLLGLLSEVTGGVLVLRALFSGVFFSLLVSAARFALMHFLPGFGDDETAEEPGEEGLAREKDSDQGFQGRQVDIVLGQEDDDSNAETGDDEDDEVEDFDSGDEFVPQDLAAAAASGSDTEEAGPSADETPAPAVKTGSSRGDMPDIGQFEANFTGGEEDVTGDKKANPVSAEILGGLHDTEEMAKAVHTILQKDQEG